jgi:hypothetical protein
MFFIGMDGAVCWLEFSKMIATGRPDMGVYLHISHKGTTAVYDLTVARVLVTLRNMKLLRSHRRIVSNFREWRIFDPGKGVGANEKDTSTCVRKAVHYGSVSGQIQ